MSITVNSNTVNFDLNNIIWWIIIGLIAGLLASVITRRGGSLLGDIILGIVGAFVGGFLLSLIGLSTYGLLGTILAATLGAIVLILLARALTGGRYRRRI
ncbi:MAG TPA: GlsB/YeaQ/YmgE family stress response membrane protein [Chloroflexia bacterium]|nr:GlsB/YeaQ/YmgE family stress response membrane protein [Chloroflexia bacterium]